MPRSRGRRQHRTEEHWRTILGRFESSGLGAAEFCRRDGIPLSSFQRWRQRVPLDGSARFVELVPPTPAVAAAYWSIEVVLPNGTCLRFRE
jgi:hypothetical protein